MAGRRRPAREEGRNCRERKFRDSGRAKHRRARGDSSYPVLQESRLLHAKGSTFARCARSKLIKRQRRSATTTPRSRSLRSSGFRDCSESTGGTSSTSSTPRRSPRELEAGAPRFARRTPRFVPPPPISFAHTESEPNAATHHLPPSQSSRQVPLDPHTDVPYAAPTFILALPH